MPLGGLVPTNAAHQTDVPGLKVQLRCIPDDKAAWAWFRHCIAWLTALWRRPQRQWNPIAQGIPRVHRCV